MPTEKNAPIGICDHCLGPIHPDEHYTSKGHPRRYCCRDCRNTANSRNSTAIRAEKARERVEAGQWVNPRELMTPEQISAIQSAASRTGRLREIAEGRWRNPGLSPESRAKNSAKQHQRFVDPAQREKIAATNRAKPRPDARTNTASLDIQPHLMPHAKSVYVLYDANTKTICVEQTQIVVDTTAPKRAGNPYAIISQSNKLRISCVQKLKIPAGIWRCIDNTSNVLMFERI